MSQVRCRISVQLQNGTTPAGGTCGQPLRDKSVSTRSDEAGIEWKRHGRIHGALFFAGQVKELSDLALREYGREEQGEGEVEDMVTACGR